jgi:hypothetical protein
MRDSIGHDARLLQVAGALLAHSDALQQFAEHEGLVT